MTRTPPDAPVELAPRLQALLQRLDRRIDDYLDYLQQLHGAIRDNDATRLEQLLPHAPALQQAIDDAVNERADLLDAQGADGLDSLFRRLGNPPDLLQARQQVEQQLERLRRQLMSNDLLLRKSRQRLRQSIGILAGHFDSPQASAYSRDGGLSSASQRRSLARA